MPGRHYTSANGYRYGFNGMEKDDEVKGNNNSLDFGARIYDPRVGRWLSLDPLAAKYPSLSPYNFVANSPLLYIDPDGKKIEYSGNIFFRIRAKLKVAFLKTFSTTARKMIKTMQGDEHIHTIKKDKTGEGSRLKVIDPEGSVTEGIGSDTEIHLNLKDSYIERMKKEDPGVSKAAIMADEFSTAARAHKGEIIEGKNENGVPLEEIEAVKESNIVREEIQPVIDSNEEAIPRTTYGTDFFGKPIKILDEKQEKQRMIDETN